MKKGSKSAELFSELVDEVILLHRSVKNPLWRMMLDEEILWAKKSSDERRMRKQALQRLRIQGLIEIKKIGKGIRLDFTDRARHRILIAKIRNVKNVLPKGKVCVVCLDIPERARGVRRSMNSVLEAAGFNRVQKSVWEGQSNIISELDELIKQHRAHSWISIYLADNPRDRR